MSSRLKRIQCKPVESVKLFRRFLPGFALALVLIAILPYEGSAQFLSRSYRPLWDEPYENYGDFGYVGYRVIDETRIFDPLGNYLIDGASVFQLEEYRTVAPLRGSSISKYGYFANPFENLVITGDAYKGWWTKFIIGNAVGTVFTPLTLSISRLDGLRWDTTSHRNKFSIVASRFTNPTGLKDIGTYLLGGHWEAAVGDVLVFGASYVNLHHTDSFMGRKQGSMKGSVPTRINSPESIYVMFNDDSPGDGSGVRVYDLEILVNGEPLEDEPDVEIFKLDLSSEMDDNAIDFVSQNAPWLTESMIFTTLEKMLKDPVEEDTDFMEAEDTTVLIYRFNLDPESRDVGKDVSFRALVSGDYSIDLVSAMNQENLPKPWVDWHNVRRARGNPMDHANLERISISYGFPTGMAITGLNLRANLFGTDLNMEYTNNYKYFQYPTKGGLRTQKKSDAYFVNALKDVGGWLEIGGELFNISPDYTSSFGYWKDGTQLIRYYKTVDDNDDRDEWPDSWEHGDPGDNILKPSLDARENLGSGIPWPVGQGVFPGLDRDEDGIIDTNLNDNQIPDYLEPFLMYYVDPDDFIYGDDFNNNGIVDDRENDNSPDYPYDWDSRGNHLFAIFKPADGLSLRFGRYDVKRIALEGRNETTYGEVNWNRNFAKQVRLSLNHRIKRVKDNIPDPVYYYVIDPAAEANFSLTIRNDILKMRNSLVNTSFLEALFSGIPRSNFTGSFKYEVNSQRESAFVGGGLQGNRNIREWSFILKGDHTWKVKNFKLIPMLKYMRHRVSAPSSPELALHEYRFAPIIRVDYPLGENTTFRFGVQGLPFFRDKFRDLEREYNDYDAVNYVYLLENLSDYMGYRLSTMIGYKRERKEFTGIEGISPHTFAEYFILFRVGG